MVVDFRTSSLLWICVKGKNMPTPARSSVMARNKARLAALKIKQMGTKIRSLAILRASLMVEYRHDGADGAYMGP